MVGNKDVSVLINGRGIFGVFQTLETLKNLDLDKIPEGSKFILHSTDKSPVDEAGGAAWSLKSALNQYPALITTNTLIDKTDASEAGLLKDFLQHLTLSAEHQAFRDKFPDYDWNGLNKKIADKEEVYVPRIVIGKYIEDAWKQAEDIANKSEGKVELVAHTGTVINIRDRLNNDDKNVPLSLIDKNGNETIIKADIIHDIGRASTRSPIKDSNGNELKSKYIRQNPLGDKEFGITVEDFKQAKEKGEKLTVVLQGLGNTGMDLVRIVNHLAKEADNSNFEIIAFQRHNSGITVHSSEPIRKETSERLTKLFKSATTADELWELYKSELDKTKYKPGELITQNKNDVPANVGESADRPQHIADILRAAINDISINNFSPEETQKWYENYHRFVMKDRNRATQDMADEITSLRDSGHLKIVTGKISDVSLDDTGHPVIKNESNHVGVPGEIKGNVFLLNAVAPYLSNEKSYQLDREEYKKGVLKVKGAAEKFHASCNYLELPEYSGIRDVFAKITSTRKAISSQIESLFADIKKAISPQQDKAEKVSFSLSENQNPYRNVPFAVTTQLASLKRVTISHGVEL